METTLWKFRIFRARDHYADASQIKLDKVQQHSSGIESRVTVGKIPTSYVHAYVMADRILQSFLSQQDISTKDIEAPPEWKQPGELYTCIRVSIKVSLKPSEPLVGDYFWYDYQEAKEKVDAFSQLARKSLDSITGKLIGLKPDALLDAVICESRIYLEGSDKPVQPLLKFKMGNPRVAITHPAGSLDLQGIEESPLAEQENFKLFEASGRWFTLALGEGDPFRRFMWAFAGIEVLAGAADKELRIDFIKRLGDSGKIADDVVERVVWPRPNDESSDPYRSLLFKFTAMSLIVSPDRVTSDSATFREVQNFRNRIHGSRIDEDVVSERADQALALLKHYGPAVIAYVSAKA